MDYRLSVALLHRGSLGVPIPRFESKILRIVTVKVMCSKVCCKWKLKFIVGPLFAKARLNIFEKGIFVAWFESFLRLSSVLVLFCVQGTVTSAKSNFSCQDQWVTWMI